MWDDLGMSQGNPAFARDAARAAGYQRPVARAPVFFYFWPVWNTSGPTRRRPGRRQPPLRHRILTAACRAPELAAFFTGPAEAGRLQELSVKDRFGTPSASRFRRWPRCRVPQPATVDREAA